MSAGGSCEPVRLVVNGDDPMPSPTPPPSTCEPVRLVVNGDDREVSCAPGDTLLAVLRERLGLTGAKFGCGIGYCGACTVLVDGAAAHSCCLLAATLEGRHITTIEGVSESAPDTVQQAFLETGAVQCGYCTPGFVLSVRALLAENPEPSEAETRAFLTGNICRCSGYAAIVRAALAAGDDR